MTPAAGCVSSILRAVWATILRVVLRPKPVNLRTTALKRYNVQKERQQRTEMYELPHLGLSLRQVERAQNSAPWIGQVDRKARLRGHVERQDS